ncbi:GNAT family N-acetyltransferase [Streptomyces sp. NPDC056352]|uniref:GNAT family N-acetyltransferase n=1 Tax=Streptomyces sp. NPDC056352 TaxID=3345791 RepID=UPI0035DE4104
MSIRITPLTDPDRGPSSHRLAWLAAGPTGAPTGSAFLRLFATTGQDHLAELELDVHPADRRNGIGSQLLEAAVATARSEGRSCVTAQVDAGSSGDRFLTARGFRKVRTLTFARRALARADLAALTEIVRKPAPGYRLTSWAESNRPMRAINDAFG